MKLESVNIFQLASRRMNWLADRQKVVSENIANADSAGFRARDVQSFDSYLRASDLSAKNPEVAVFELDETWSDSLSGNNVVLEEQMILSTDTASKYRLASNLYRKAHQMVLAAAGSR